MTREPLYDVRALGAVAAVTVATTTLVALAGELTVGSAMRHWLDFRFNGLAPGVHTAITIFLNNMKLVAIAVTAAAVAQMRVYDRPMALLAVNPAALKWLERASALALWIVASINVVIVGIAIGAYGWRMCVAMLPHGPVEIAAYCVAFRLYLVARRLPLSRGNWLFMVGLAVGLLAIAAVLETFAWIG